jgi:hypothetical protein
MAWEILIYRNRNTPSELSSKTDRFIILNAISLKIPIEIRVSVCALGESVLACVHLTRRTHVDKIHTNIMHTGPQTHC